MPLHFSKVRGILQLLAIINSYRYANQSFTEYSSRRRVATTIALSQTVSFLHFCWPRNKISHRLVSLFTFRLFSHPFPSFQYEYTYPHIIKESSVNATAVVVFRFHTQRQIAHNSFDWYPNCTQCHHNTSCIISATEKYYCNSTYYTCFSNSWCVSFILLLKLQRI